MNGEETGQRRERKRTKRETDRTARMVKLNRTKVEATQKHE